MAIPTREQARSILRELHAQGWLIEHSTAVADVAAFLAARIRQRGTDLPPDLPETAALLHDVDKTPGAGDLRKRLGHGYGSAAWLTDHGYAELAPAVVDHPATRLGDERAFDAWLRDASLAAKLVSYADKRATQDLVPMSERFAKWQQNHPERADEIARGQVLAERLEREVCAAAGVMPAEVQRL
jgi:HD superfamily phosphodiesterase